MVEWSWSLPLSSRSRNKTLLIWWHWCQIAISSWKEWRQKCEICSDGNATPALSRDWNCDGPTIYKVSKGIFPLRKRAAFARCYCCCLYVMLEIVGCAHQFCFFTKPQVKKLGSETCNECTWRKRKCCWTWRLFFEGWLLFSKRQETCKSFGWGWGEGSPPGMYTPIVHIPHANVQMIVRNFWTVHVKMVSTLWTSACTNFRHVYIALVKHVADVCLDQQVATVAQSSIRRLQMVVKEKEEAILSLQNAVSAAYQAALQEQAHNQAQLEALHAVLSVHGEHSIEHMHQSLQVVHRPLFMSNRFPPAGSTCIITYSGNTL